MTGGGRDPRGAATSAVGRGLHAGRRPRRCPRRARLGMQRPLNAPRGAVQDRRLARLPQPPTGGKPGTHEHKNEGRKELAAPLVPIRPPFGLPARRNPRERRNENERLSRLLLSQDARLNAMRRNPSAYQGNLSLVGSLRQPLEQSLCHHIDDLRKDGRPTGIGRKQQQRRWPSSKREQTGKRPSRELSAPFRTCLLVHRTASGACFW